MSALYELADQYRALQRLDASEDLPLKVIQDTLEGLEGALEIKATNVAKFIMNADAMASAIEDAAKKMRERAARLRTRTEHMREYLRFNMVTAEKLKIESPELVLSIQKNPPSVLIEDESAIPFRYMVIPPPAPPPAPRPDKKKIADDLKAGNPVPGCKLDQGTRLVIKE